MAKARSGVITVTTAGTAVQGPTYPKASNDKVVWIVLKADPGNSDAVFFGNTGSNDITSADGFPLGVGESMAVQLNSLDELWFDAAADGDKIRWLRARD